MKKAKSATAKLPKKRASHPRSSLVVNVNVYGRDQLTLWNASNSKRPVVYTRLDRVTKNDLDYVVAVKETTKATYILNLVARAVQSDLRAILGHKHRFLAKKH